MNNLNVLSAIADLNPPLPRLVADHEMITFLGMADISDTGRIINRQEKEFVRVKQGFTRFAENDVIFAKITPCMENGKGAIARGLKGGIGCGSTEFHILRAKENGCADYIYYLTLWKRLRQKAEMQMTGSAGQKRVPSSFFNEFKVYIPNIDEQHKIARILTSINKVIEQTENVIEKLKKIKQGMMHDLFARGIDVKTGQLRPPQSEAPELYKQSMIGWIPIDWECDTTENISKRIWIGLVTTMTTHYVEDGIPLIRNNNIRDNKIDVSDIIFLDRRFSEQNKQRYLHKGDVVTVHTGDIGTSAIIPDHLDPAHGFATINTTVNEKIILNSYLCDYFNTPIFKNRIEAYATGDGRSNFNLYDYLYINIPFPKLLDEQTAITAKLKSINDLLENEDYQLRKIVKLKEGLMQDLLTGKVPVVPDPQDKGVN